MIFLLYISCSAHEDSKPDASIAEDAGRDAAFPIDGGFQPWAPWPPEPGNAGVHFTWTISDMIPNASDCVDAGVSSLALLLVSPNRSEDWSSPDLEAPCDAAQAGCEPKNGLAAGRYRFRIDITDRDGGLLSQHPEGTVTLKAGRDVQAASVNITKGIEE